MALELLSPKGMSEFLDLLYRYRQVVTRCREGADLNMDEIQLLASVQRDLPREVKARALLVGPGLEDLTRVAAVGPEGIVCSGAPGVKIGARIEVRLEDEAQRRSYRFKARVEWASRREDGFELGLSFFGAPLLIRRSPHERVPAVIQQFAA